MARVETSNLFNWRTGELLGCSDVSELRITRKQLKTKRMTIEATKFADNLRSGFMQQ